ncbi:hypothetical protein V5799_020395 [Amblyomma americanum]|uniref:SWIM-type domain-containing protein n=1 Tax=Amblyomma americanum TaxID=6943 RepID=A0AAQ4ETY4_AMBAM
MQRTTPRNFAASNTSVAFAPNRFLLRQRGSVCSNRDPSLGRRLFYRGFITPEVGGISKDKDIRSVLWLSTREAVYHKSTCLPSKNSGNYNQLVMLSRETMKVVQALYECTAGLSETCQHIAALLFAGVDLKTPSTTDQQCAWIVPY